MKRAMEKYDVNVVGLTLSKNQRAFSRQLLDQIATNFSHRVLLRGWEEIGDPVDRMVSIEAFEAFGKPRYAAFFEMAYRLLPSDGRLVLEAIFTHPPSYWHKNGIPITMSDLRFMRLLKRYFPVAKCHPRKTSSNSRAAPVFRWKKSST
jgi:cyclopropane-fatty-acyl-phospholipid synthase